MRWLVVAAALAACKGENWKKAKDSVERYAADQKARRAEEAADAAWRPSGSPPPELGVGSGSSTGWGAPRGPDTIISDGTYRLKRVTVKALPKKRDGTPWDPAPEEPPELEIRVTIDGLVVASCDGPRDSLVATCELDQPVQLRGRSVIELDVVDDDALLDDPIGQAHLDILAALNFDLVMQVNHRLDSASLVFAAPPPQPNYLLARLLGLGVGVVGALAILGSFQRGLLPHPPPKPEPPRCKHCEKLLAASDLTRCAHCGAAQ